MTNEPNAYVGAYPFLRGRRAVWREIARYVSRDARDAATVLELGAGYCDFINEFPASRKLAFDLNPEMRAHAAADVELRIQSALDLDGIAPNSVDLVFASNFLEHLSQDELGVLLPAIRNALRPGGRFIVVQPNYRLCREHYFDDPTHVTIFSDETLPQQMQHHGLRVLKLIPGLLPFSMNSRLPKSGFLTRLYLLSPWKPLAAQMYAVMGRA
jgi:SAM-dependent methyltransferase